MTLFKAIHIQDTLGDSLIQRLRPVINFTTNCSPHHAGCEASTITNTHVPFIATARATPGT